MNPAIKSTIVVSVAFVLGTVAGVLGTNFAVEYANKSASSAFVAMVDDAYARKNPDEAIELLHRAICANPDYYAPFFQLGDIYADRGNSETALRMYRAALEKTSNKNPTIFDSYESAAVHDRKVIEAKISKISKTP